MEVRPGAARDAHALTAVETVADALLVDALGARQWPVSTRGDQRLAAPGFVVVAEEDSPLLSRSSVSCTCSTSTVMRTPSSFRYSRRAGGGSGGHHLVERAMTEARSHGYPRMTLRTYAEIPWNAPFYASCGFLERIPETPSSVSCSTRNPRSASTVMAVDCR